MPEQDVHEIQLNGKQLVFMFMAATVVSIVIFLCGVMVGRGVRPPQPEALAFAATADEAFDSADPIGASAPSSVETTAPVPVPVDELTYVERLEAPGPPNDRLKPAARVEPKPAPPVADAPAAPASEVTPAPIVEKAAASATARTDTARTDSTFAEPRGDGHVVQVMAFASRADALALAARLAAKGYPAFVTGGGGAAKTMYRVRVGKYDTRKEAQTVASRLKQEEKFDPWLPPR